MRQALTNSTRHKARKVAQKELQGEAELLEENDEALDESRDHLPEYDDLVDPQAAPPYSPNRTSRDMKRTSSNQGRSNFQPSGPPILQVL